LKFSARCPTSTRSGPRVRSVHDRTTRYPFVRRVGPACGKHGRPARSQLNTGA
jgi:hypothetical protein